MFVRSYGWSNLTHCKFEIVHLVLGPLRGRHGSIRFLYPTTYIRIMTHKRAANINYVREIVLELKRLDGRPYCSL